MEKQKEKKVCNCAEPDFNIGLLPLSPEKYKGTVICSTCQGLIQFPIRKSLKQKGDEVNRFVKNLAVQPMNIEKATLLTLIDIKESLKPKLIKGEKIKGTLENTKEKGKEKGKK